MAGPRGEAAAGVSPGPDALLGLPASPAAASAVPPGPAVAPAMAPAAPAPAGGWRVLVVDDDAVDRMIVRRGLARAGLGVVVSEAGGAGEALALLATGAFDCVLLDYNLPDADGLALLGQVRALCPDLPVVALTGQGDEQVAVALMKAGAADYVPKAMLTTERLAQTLRYAVELGRAAAATRQARQALETAAERTRFLADASRVLAGSLDVATTLQAVAQLSVPRLGDFCVISLVEHGAAEGVAAAHADPAMVPLVREFERWYRPRLDHPTSGVMRAIRERRTLRMPTVPEGHLATLASGEDELRVLRALRPATALFVPLVARDTVLGAASFVRTSPSPHDDAEVALAEDLAQRAALALDNARLFAMATDARRRAEQSAARTARLQRLTAALAGAATEAEVGRLVMEHGVLATGAYAGVIAVPVAGEPAVELGTCMGYPPEACMHVGRRWPADARIPLAEAIRTRAAVWVPSPAAWAERYAGGYSPVPTNAPADTPAAVPPSASRAWAAVPLEAEGGVLGAILWSFDAPHEFDPDERALLEAIARQCAQALERARLRDAERRARAAAEEANRVKGEFLARMSHDLRTPLNAIGGYAQLIEMGVHGPVTPEQAGAVARISRAQAHLLTLINDILSFAKLEAGQVRVTPETVPVAPVLEELAALVRPDAEARGLALDLDVPAALPAVRADRARLMQVLLNLASNAIKFTDAGRVRITAAADDGRVAFSVRDTGRGVPADRLETIFAPFVQARGAADEQMGGVGLGLAIGRELARLMGGELTAESEEGRGSTFTLRLPAAP